MLLLQHITVCGGNYGNLFANFYAFKFKIFVLKHLFSGCVMRSNFCSPSTELFFFSTLALIIFRYYYFYTNYKNQIFFSEKKFPFQHNVRQDFNLKFEKAFYFSKAQSQLKFWSRRIDRFVPKCVFLFQQICAIIAKYHQLHWKYFHGWVTVTVP